MWLSTTRGGTKHPPYPRTLAGAMWNAWEER